MYTESTFGSAVVEYDAFFHPPYACDDFLYAPGMNKGMIELHYVSVKDIVVFDDDGNSVPLDSNAIDACTKIVMDAFEAIVSDVKEFELEIRHA